MRRLLLWMGLLVGCSTGYVLSKLYAAEEGNIYRQRLQRGAEGLRQRLMERLETFSDGEITLG
jgi:hypothetical protein